jgi:hypothetical protein
VPKYTDDDLQVAVEAAYLSALHEAERKAIAGYGQMQLDGRWVRRAVRTFEELVTERKALMAIDAVAINRRRGRPDGWVFPGGPVCWATGDRRCPVPEGLACRDRGVPVCGEAEA